MAKSYNKFCIILALPILPLTLQFFECIERRAPCATFKPIPQCSTPRNQFCNKFHSKKHFGSSIIIQLCENHRLSDQALYNWSTSLSTDWLTMVVGICCNYNINIKDLNTRAFTYLMGGGAHCRCR